MSDKTSLSFELMLPKGMRDIDPPQKILQMKVLDTIREVFELYGYTPLETPLVERMDVLMAKFAVGEGTDVSKEIFSVRDQGDRELGLRFDMTVPLCRYVAMNPTVKLPFKRYVMGKVFRDGPIKLGRYREFWQADADIVGVPGPLADAEGLLMAADVFSKFELDVTFYCSSRELLYELMDHLQIPSDLRNSSIIALDKLKKIGKMEVMAEMMKAGLSKKQAEELLKVTSCGGTHQEKIEVLRKALPQSPALDRLEEIFRHLSSVKNLVFDPSLSRGLAYYTGFFFECFLNTSKITSSLVGTGRYDNMIGDYLEGKQQFAAVGISFGVSVICDALQEKEKELQRSLTTAYVIPVSQAEVSAAQKLASELRQAGVRTDMDLLGRSIGKNFSYADTMGIPYAIVLGEDEVSESKCMLKDMSSGTQELISQKEAIARLSEF